MDPIHTFLILKFCSVKSVKFSSKNTKIFISKRLQLLCKRRLSTFLLFCALYGRSKTTFYSELRSRRNRSVLWNWKFSLAPTLFPHIPLPSIAPLHLTLTSPIKASPITQLPVLNAVFRIRIWIRIHRSKCVWAFQIFLSSSNILP